MFVRPVETWRAASPCVCLFFLFRVKERRGSATSLQYHLNYFTIALTASSPSTATTTIPCGAAIVALSEVITVLATT